MFTRYLLIAPEKLSRKPLDGHENQEHPEHPFQIHQMIVRFLGMDNGFRLQPVDIGFEPVSLISVIEFAPGIYRKFSQQIKISR